MLWRATCRYKSVRDPLTALRTRLRELAEARVRWGYRRLTILLKREGWQVGHKRVCRLYREEGLQIRRRKPHRHVSAKIRLARPSPASPNQAWSMDFVSDAMFGGAALRALTIVDDFSRESLAIEVGKGFTGERVSRVLDRIISRRGRPVACKESLSGTTRVCTNMSRP
jgi:putative transposase